MSCDVLKSMNEELFDHRWTDDDLRELTAPRFGVVSGFASLARDLKEILAQDLGDTAPSDASRADAPPADTSLGDAHS